MRLRTAIPIEELRLSVLPAEGACGDDSFKNLSPKSSKKVQQRTWRMHFYDVRSRDVHRCGRVGCPDFFSETPLRTWRWTSRGEKLAPSPAVSDWILWMIGCANRVSTNAPISASIALSCRAAALLHQHTLDPPAPTLTSSRLQFASKFNTEMASVMRTSSARPCIYGALGKYNECIEAMEIGGSCRSGRWGWPMKGLGRISERRKWISQRNLHPSNSRECMFHFCKVFGPNELGTSIVYYGIAHSHKTISSSDRICRRRRKYCKIRNGNAWPRAYEKAFISS